MLPGEIFREFKEGRLEPFYKWLYPGLLQYAVRYLNDRSYYAEDCIQNAVYKSWERRDNFDSEYAHKAFLYLTIRNEIISIHRNSSAKERFLEKNRDLNNHDTFINSIIDQEAKTLLFKYILELPEREREVCILSYIEGLSNEDIAQQMDISLATVKRSKAKAIKSLRNGLKDALLIMLPLLIR